MIVCEGATKSYKSQAVLRGVDLVVEPGICALLGANGAGKSTLLRLLSGLERPDSGSVSIGGLSFHGLSSRDEAVSIKRTLGVVPEGLGLFESLTIIENLSAAGPIYGLTRDETAQRSTDLLELLGLEDGRHTPARECSFGMRKKTALAMALLHKPRVLLLDEPFEGIDPFSSGAIQSLLLRLAASSSTILLTSHILPIVETLADRVVILRDGRIASDFRPGDTGISVEQTYFDTVGSDSPEVPEWLSS